MVDYSRAPARTQAVKSILPLIVIRIIRRRFRCNVIALFKLFCETLNQKGNP